MNNIQFNFRDFLNSIIIFLGIIVILFNIVKTLPKFTEKTKEIRLAKFTPPGEQFKELKSNLKNIKRVGYLTDKDMSSERNDGQFLEAQHFFAPTILDLGNIYHEYLIFDYTNLPDAYHAVAQLEAKFIKATSHGKILARRIRQ